jgi:anti-sigma factor RsiW
MLSDQVTQLLTAFVDGELSQRQRKTVMRVLHKSSEARAILRQLQENAHKIKQLPRRKLEPSLVDAVMQAIAEQKAQPKQPAAARSVRRRWLPYVTAALAASLVAGVISIFAWKAFKEEGQKNDGVVVKIDDKKPEPKPEPAPTPTPRKPNPAAGVDGGRHLRELRQAAGR